MEDKKLDPQNDYWEREYRFQWDFMGLAIYYGKTEIVKILEEIDIMKGD